MTKMWEGALVWPGGPVHTPERSRWWRGRNGPVGAKPRRGELRIFLGAAPGVGKTFSMLGEAHRRRERGTDVVIGFVETCGRVEVAVVDELAHTNVPGSRNAKRWQDVEELLEAGIDVLSTVNVQHLESLNDVVQRITGVPQQETVPDEVVRKAGQMQLVDLTPRRCDAGSPTATFTRRTRSTRLSATTSASATSPRSASSRCSGLPTRSTSP